MQQFCRHHLRIVLLLWLSIFAVSVDARSVADESATQSRRRQQFTDRHADIKLGLRADLEAVRIWCHGKRLDAEASQVAELTETLCSEHETALPRMARLPVSPQLPLEQQQWRLQVQHHRTDRGKQLYSLARSALRAGFPSLAFDMISDVVRTDPDHKFARGVLGQQLFRDASRRTDPTYAGEWVSPFEATMRSGSKPHVRHPDFGWIPASHVVRYEEGLRPWKGEWVSAEKEGELRRSFRNAWEIPSEHFLVKTNLSLEAGVELSNNLEIFHDWLQQNLAAFFDTPESMQDRFEDASRRRRGTNTHRPMEVHFYATKAEYDRRVKGKIPPNVETNGLYWQPDRTSYFFNDPDKSDWSTLYHEATHQILDVATSDDRNKAARVRALKLRQRKKTPWDLCGNSNFWMIEGLACYFESFEIRDGTVSVGRPDYTRFDTARKRLLVPGLFFYVPQQQFMALGKDAFQRHGNVSQLYTQASGTVHFLLHYQDGRYRDDFVTLLSTAYRPDLKHILQEPSFDRISGVPFDQLDREYRDHMQILDDQLAGRK
jgi:hypothetical protein